MNYYITGDTHGNFSKLKFFAERMKTSQENDCMIILGDAGVNYNVLKLSKGEYIDKPDNMSFKRYLKRIPLTFFIIQGNHECPAWHMYNYKEKEWNGGIVYYQESYPNLLFAKNGEIYTINGKKVICLGGAYSVDKFYRLEKGYHWFEEEQPSHQDKEYAMKILNKEEWTVDYVLSHTCPYSYIPVETFLAEVDQSTVDNSTEKWLQQIENIINYKRWYCGHYHTEKHIDDICFMYESISLLD